MRKAWFFCFLLAGLLAGCVSKPSGGRPPRGLRDPRRDRPAAQPEPVRNQAHRPSPCADRSCCPTSRRQSDDALGRGYLRFQVERCPSWSRSPRRSRRCRSGSRIRVSWPPARRSRTTTVAGVLFRKTFPPGWIGLGVNGLDRSPPAHYVVFLHSPRGCLPLAEDSIVLGRAARPLAQARQPRPGVSAREVSRPFAAMPASLEGSSCSSRSTTGATPRCWRPGGSGRRRVPSGTLRTRSRSLMDPIPPTSWSGAGEPRRHRAGHCHPDRARLVSRQPRTMGTRIPT